MPFRPQHSLLRVDVPALRSVDTYSAADLFGMWSLFSRTSDAMEEGKRLENLSWRLWNRETFCCDARSTSTRSPRTSFPSSLTSRPVVAAHGEQSVPSLSSSLDSMSSDGCDDDVAAEGGAPGLASKARPELRRASPSSDSQHARATKHITPNHLADIVESINQTKSLEPLELPTLRPLEPASASAPPCQGLADLCLKPVSRAATPATESRPVMSHAVALEESASTVATDEPDKASPPVGSDTSSNTGMSMSTHSVVRGFAPSSYRSQTNLAAQPTPILKTSPAFHPSRPKQKGAMFTIGTSSGEDESSFENHMYKSSLSESLRRKQTSFREDVAVGRAAEQHSVVFETDEEDEEVSESAIEDDDDSSDWEDSEDQSRPSSVTDRGLFQRVDSRPNLTSHRSLLTTLMHEPDRAKALATAASRSTPALRRSRTATPTTPSTATSPDPGHLMPADHQRGSAALPVLATTSNTQPVQVALSPRTTRRNMLSTELTDSLRKNLLWERQHRSNGNLAALRRRHTSHDVKNLRQLPEPVMLQPSQNGPLQSGAAGARTFNNDYFNHGLQEYHTKGW